MTPEPFSPGRRGENGSALVEAAIVLPVLLLLLYGSVALTDVLVLRLKGSEAARFALFESAVFRGREEIAEDLRSRFSDLRSPASIDEEWTGLTLYPRRLDLAWSADVVHSGERVFLGGKVRAPFLPRWMRAPFETVLGSFTSSVDAALRAQGFNTEGTASVRVAVAASNVRRWLGGGDLGGMTSLDRLLLSSPAAERRPLRLVFDTWKAWPKPARFTRSGASTDPRVSPMRSYPVVEEQVSAQVSRIAFLGLHGIFSPVTSRLASLVDGPIGNAVFGGKPPDPFSTGRMDGGSSPGPITIRPVESPDVPWVPGQGLHAQRVGEIGHDRGLATLDGEQALTSGADRARYTVPFRIQTSYWAEDGGADEDAQEPRLRAPPPEVEAQENGYTRAFRCRGHFFSGAIASEESDPRKRYRPGCW